MNRLRWAVAVAASAAMVLSGCAPGGDEASGDSDGPIEVGVIADLTGATGDVGTPYNKGMLGYIKWRNSEGGIDGRDIKAFSKDYAYDVPTAERLYK
jgi:branched-chain amino acid transport system substrate-binding protein